MSKRCLGCMKMKENSPVCEHCGYNENIPNYPHQLPIGTMLKGRYTVGKVLGQGGFGITYIGWDNALEAPIAIKEYYPNSFVTRESAFSLEVHCAGEGAEELFRHNRERFLKEAKILAKLQNVPGIVRVQNLFAENNTAYIVMEYVEGIDLKHYIRMQNRCLTVQEVLSVMRPVIYALSRVHEVELVHRDISPDNIMILPDGSAKLLDFGAAREVENAEVDKELPQSTEAILKHGFAPMEQYRRRGSLGPWTDVYALCATMYYCLTGKVPNSAPERIMGDDNVNWHRIPGLSKQQIQTLEKGLALMPENRIRTMRQLHNGLFSQTTLSPAQAKKEEPKSKKKPEPQKKADKQPEPVKKPEKKAPYPTHTVSLESDNPASVVTQTKKKAKKKPAAFIAAALAAVAAAGLFFLKPGEKDIPATLPEVIPSVTEETTPAVLSPEQLSFLEAEELEAAGEFGKAAIAFGKLGDYKDARERSYTMWTKIPNRNTVFIHVKTLFALRKDGTLAVDDYHIDTDLSEYQSEKYKNIVSIYGEVFLKNDGTLILPPYSEWEHRMSQSQYRELETWTDLIAFSSESNIFMGLKSDGTVVATVLNDNYNISAEDIDVSGWKDIIAIECCGTHLLGLKSDGTVVATGNNGKGQCNVSDWTDIVDITCSNFDREGFSIGLKSDGSIIFTGSQYTGFKTYGWENLTDLFHGPCGLKQDGTVITQIVEDGTINKPNGVTHWTDIVSLTTNGSYTAGLKSDGSLVITSTINPKAFTEAKTWTDILLPYEVPNIPKSDSTTVGIQPDAEAVYTAAEALEAAGEYGKAAIAFGKLGDYKDARERSFAIWEKITYRETLPTNWTKQDNWWDKAFVGLKTDGTVASAFPPVDAVTEWTDVVAVESGSYPDGSFVIGLKKDGTVVTTIANNAYTEYDTSNWTDIVAIDARNGTAVGLKADGTVVAIGTSNWFADLDLSKVSAWTDIVSVYTTGSCTIGLKADGTVVACGNGAEQISGWTDIASISVSGDIIGIKKNGTLVASGIGGARTEDISDWTDIIAVDTNAWGNNIVGLRSDGTVVAVGPDNDHNKIAVSGWSDIVEVYTTDNYTIGLRADGTVVGTGLNINGCLNVEKWTDIVSLRVWYGCTVGLKSDGTVVFAGKGHAALNNWTDIKCPAQPILIQHSKENTSDSPSGNKEAYAAAEALENAGEFGKAAIAFGKLGDYKDARDRSFGLWDKVAQRGTIAAGAAHVVALKEDGTVVADGQNRDGQCNIAGASGIVAVDAGAYYTALLKSDGTIMISGANMDGINWSDIVAISASQVRLVGLRCDGTVVVAGKNAEDYDISRWSDIVAVSAWDDRVMGLRSDGTVVVIGWEEEYRNQVGDWYNLASISTSGYHAFGLTTDGKVKAAGWNTNYTEQVSQWRNIVQIQGASVEAGPYILGLRSDGTLTRFGGNTGDNTILQWKDIVAFDIQTYQSQTAKRTVIGLKSDGTVVISNGSTWIANYKDAVNWKNIKLPTQVLPMTQPGVNTTAPSGKVLSPGWKETIVSTPGYKPFESIAQIEYISFLDTLKDAPEKTWDVSEDGDGSVLAWAESSNLGALPQFHVYIAAEGGVCAPANSKWLFGAKPSGMTNLRSITFNDAFYTGNVINMEGMFCHASIMSQLNLSCFNTSQVTSMKDMFFGCRRLTSLNLSSFDTSSVVNMIGMFTGSRRLTDLNLGKFDTSSVTSYKDFMDEGMTINGQPWEKLFEN